MMDLSRVQQSRTHLALLRALGVLSEAPETAEGRARAEFAYAASRSSEPLAEAILLASALRGHAGRGSFSFAMKELAKTCDNQEMAESAGKLVGGIHIGRGIWSTKPDQNAPRVQIPTHLFREFLEEWACYLPQSRK